MSIKDGAEIRKIRLQNLLDLIKGHPEDDENEIRGLFMVQTGLSKAKVEQYLQDLESARLIKRENGHVKPSASN